jgi:hypothetical protein
MPLLLLLFGIFTAKEMFVFVLYFHYNVLHIKIVYNLFWSLVFILKFLQVWLIKAFRMVLFLPRCLVPE